MFPCQLLFHFAFLKFTVAVTSVASLPGKCIKQWSSAVLGYSSSLDTSECAASHLPGPPKVYPKNGEPGAWKTSIRDDHSWVELEFPTAVMAEAVAIWETYKAGGVVAIKAREGGRGVTSHVAWVTLWEAPGRRGENFFRSSIFSPRLTRRCVTNVIRLELEGGGFWHRQIDAVQLEGRPVTGV